MKMNRRGWLIVGILAAVAAAAALLLLGARPDIDPERSSRPNIVVIIIDTLRADKLGAYGYPQPTSPEIDRLARLGVRFRRVVAQSSWTRPSIGSMITGLYPRSVGIFEEQLHALDERYETLAERLKSDGYTTVGATANPNINSVFRFDQGFDLHVDSNVLWPWMEPEPGKTTTSVDSLPSSRNVLDGVLVWIDDHGAPPYYVQVNLMEVHRRHDPRVLARIGEEMFSGEPNPRYLGAIHHVSAEIGRFVDALAPRPGWENTLFVITSDHGEGLDDHPDVENSQGHASLIYESQIFVPLILYNPAGDLPEGQVIERPVRLLDLMPTLVAYAGIPLPERLEGQSLLPLLRPGRVGVTLPPNFVVETEFKFFDKIGVYTDEWKYIENRDHHPGTNPRELQRVGVKENGRLTDVAKQFPDVVERLRSFLVEWEQTHPKAPPSVDGVELSPLEIEQLRALGYLD